MVVLGEQKADRKMTVGELMGERPKLGVRYLDLNTGMLIKDVPRGTPQPAEAPPEPETVAETKKYTEDDLKKMKMSQLRKIGEPLGAKDTKKSELVAEILKLQ